jgi:hypothetical protein
MDDVVVPAEQAVTAHPGFFLLTNSTTLGLPESQLFAHPFCALKEDVKEYCDDCYVWCGEKTRCASIWLDAQVHKGQEDLIRAEMEKVDPPGLLEKAHDAFGFYFTTAPPILNYWEQELAVFRQSFPRMKLMGCTLGSTLFGNTASTVRETSTADRTVKVSYVTGRFSASMFFLVVVSK